MNYSPKFQDSQDLENLFSHEIGLAKASSSHRHHHHPHRHHRHLKDWRLKGIFYYIAAYESSIARVLPILCIITTIVIMWFFAMWALDGVLMQWPLEFRPNALRTTVGFK